MNELPCDHEFSETSIKLFVGSSGARMCERCNHIDVAISGRWISFDEYLAQRSLFPEVAE